MSNSSHPKSWSKHDFRKWILGLDPKIHCHLDVLLNLTVSEFLTINSEILKNRLQILKFSHLEILLDAKNKLVEFCQFLESQESTKSKNPKTDSLKVSSKHLLDFQNYKTKITQIVAEIFQTLPKNVGSTTRIKNSSGQGLNLNLYKNLDQILNSGKQVLSHVDKFLSKIEFLINQHGLNSDASDFRAHDSGSGQMPAPNPHVSPSKLANFFADSKIGSLHNVNENLLTSILNLRENFIILLIKLSNVVNLSLNQPDLLSQTFEENIHKILSDFLVILDNFNYFFSEIRYQKVDCFIPLPEQNSRLCSLDSLDATRPHSTQVEVKPKTSNLKLSMHIKSMYDGNFIVVHIDETGLASLATPALEICDQILCINDFPVVGWTLKALTDELDICKTRKFNGENVIKLTVSRFGFGQVNKSPKLRKLDRHKVNRAKNCKSVCLELEVQLEHGMKNRHNHTLNVDFVKNLKRLTSLTKVQNFKKVGLIEVKKFKKVEYWLILAKFEGAVKVLQNIA